MSDPHCPTRGVWKQDSSRCESLCPLLEGLGLPSALRGLACTVADSTMTTYRITCPTPDTCKIVDKTWFGRNETSVPLDGSERETKTRNGRKTFMLSGSVSDDGTSTVQCRLVSRGEGWYTRQERKVTRAGRAARARTCWCGPGTTTCVVTRQSGVQLQMEVFSPAPARAEDVR